MKVQSVQCRIWLDAFDACTILWTNMLSFEQVPVVQDITISMHPNEVIAIVSDYSSICFCVLHLICLVPMVELYNYCC